ncbi:hypothetical protein RHSIM_Rhsim08G0043200 [Rhododendron simsii]|uniref:Uncharacterized protein n=1 Tax=Rhododendron simsii TaxID=118357 RepID=A0A834GMY2_RHOSS|nr:hypothetical protein RHSIM_Rhsim08G0043200 [Rhododendron simsii]
MYCGPVAHTKFAQFFCNSKQEAIQVKAKGVVLVIMFLSSLSEVASHSLRIHYCSTYEHNWSSKRLKLGGYEKAIILVINETVEILVGLGKLNTLPVLSKNLILGSIKSLWNRQAKTGEDKQMCLSSKLLILQKLAPKSSQNQLKDPFTGWPCKTTAVWNSDSPPIIKIRKNKQTLGVQTVSRCQNDSLNTRVYNILEILLKSGLQQGSATDPEARLSSSIAICSGTNNRGQPSPPYSSTREGYNSNYMSEIYFDIFYFSLFPPWTAAAEDETRVFFMPATTRKFLLFLPMEKRTNLENRTRVVGLPSSQTSPGFDQLKFTPPKKGEGELPSPMSMEESIEAFENVGIYPQVEQWRDRLRQWFSLVLLNPLLSKIDTSHMQVMQAATKLGISITISKVGSNLPTTGTRATVSSVERPDEWQPATLDEDSLLHQLRATLVQALDASTPKLPLGNMQQSPQQNPMIPIIQECIDATTEHQRLRALMKGEWAKGLLPQSSVRADYTVQRIRELAEGTCLKNYEYLGSGEVFDKVNKKWTLELPTDSHLLLYLFCAFLEHPKWMLHVDPTSYAGAQSSKNPLFVGVLPPKERFPEKYVAVISGAPYVLHPGACILAVGRQSPPIFALYWDKKPHFSQHGRTALWDSILLLCHRINVACGGVVRGMHLGSSALGILPVLDPETEDSDSFDGRNLGRGTSAYGNRTLPMCMELGNIKEAPIALHSTCSAIKQWVCSFCRGIVKSKGWQYPKDQNGSSTKVLDGEKV